MSDLPNFFILGAAKSGTTSLHALLKQSQQVYFPFAKEPMFFSQDAFYNLGLDWYSQTFYQGTNGFALRGDATPHYLYWSEKVAPRLSLVYPAGPKMIILLRHPVERAYSWYWNMIREGNETLSFEDALAAEPKRLKAHYADLRARGAMLYGYLRGSQYAEQIQHYLKLFPQDKFLFLLYEDLSSAALHSTLERVSRFLGLDAPLEADRQALSNQASMPRSMGLQRWLRRQTPLREALKRFLPHRWRYLVKEHLLRLNLRPTRYPDMLPETRQKLNQLFTQEIRTLSDLIDRDLSHWLEVK